MITGTVVNGAGAVNFGQQNGVSLGAFLAANLPPTVHINGAVYNYGVNAGTQNGVLIRPWF